MSTRAAILGTPPTYDVETPSGRVWVCRPLGRRELAEVGLLQAALAITLNEVSRASGLLNIDLPPELREQLAEAARQGADEAAQAEPTAAPRVERWYEAIARYDRAAVAAVVGCRPAPGADVLPCRLVLDQADEAEDAIWVGLPTLVADVAAIGVAVELQFVGDTQAGRRFRLQAFARAVAG